MNPPPVPAAAAAAAAAGQRRHPHPQALAAQLDSAPPTPSRSPSASTHHTDDDSQDDDDSDFPDRDPDDPDASRLSLSLAHLAPALATPRLSARSPWPFNAAADDDDDLHPSHADEPSASGDPPAIPASSLPHEILLHILRLLPAASLAPALRVCKAWCQCGVELLWHKPAFASLSSLYKMLQVLALADPTFPYPHFVRRINFLPLAHETTDRVLEKLEPCTRIERLTLTSCKKVTSAPLARLLAANPRLIALDLSDVDSVTDDVLIALAQNCSKIQGLNLSGCSRITDRGLEAVARGCPMLRRIKLRKCDRLTDVPVILLARLCPLLLEVDLALCPSISSLATQQLLRTCHSLRELSLPGCVALADDGFPDADHLQLVPSASSSSSAPPFRENGHSPSDNDTAAGEGDDNALVTSTGSPLARPLPLRSPPALRAYDHLRYLDVTSCVSLTDRAIAGIVRYCPRLRNLMLGKCVRLTDDALYEVCKIGKHLHYLHLGHVNNITDAAVTAVARACTRLRYIDLANCSNLTDLSVFELAANLPRLKRIGLVRVTNITDDAIASLRTRTSLERIHLSYCDNLSVAAIHDLLSSLPRVTHLSLTGVTSFRKRALQQFCRQPPSNYNDHQRRSFCVFSGRGVHDLRRFFRALAPEELAALAVPDPPEDDDHALQQQQQQQLLFAQQQQAQQQLRLQGGAAPGPAPGQGALTPAQQQLTQTQARLAQIQHARQAVALAAQRLQAHQHPHQRAGPAPGTVGGVPVLPVAGGPGAGAGNMLGLQQLQPPVAYRPTRMPAPAPPAPLPQQPNAALQGANTVPMQYAAPAPSSAAGQRSSAPPEMMSFSLAAASAAAAAAAAAGAGASASTSNGAGMAAPQTPRAQTVEIEGLGEEDGGEGEEGRGQRGVRSRRDTVTRSNYRAPAGREQGDGDGDAMRIDGAEREGEDDDEEDGASDSGGEEEDISMSER
ncbi:hypothetical protein Rhopal_000745-T1 [Rhodotorula paludigena]|uniref:F-box domain-containing protein n=1 Tax=Rhodotorula paludigena TaxID=86838 RepID=A0AAV5GDG5_9BASI|nr:hypothetical protein Rhopal_000745-T1 [Rhodotorula paludigena]